MTHKATEIELATIKGCFETDRDIWTQDQLNEITGLRQPSISTALKTLVKDGIA